MLLNDRCCGYNKAQCRASGSSIAGFEPRSPEAGEFACCTAKYFLLHRRYADFLYLTIRLCFVLFVAGVRLLRLRNKIPTNIGQISATKRLQRSAGYRSVLPQPGRQQAGKKSSFFTLLLSAAIDVMIYCHCRISPERCLNSRYINRNTLLGHF